MDFHLDNIFLYRDQIRENVLVKQYYCDIDIAHLISYDEELAHKLQQDPAEIIPLVRSSIFSLLPFLTVNSSKQRSRHVHNALSILRKGTSNFQSTSYCFTRLPQNSPSAISQRTTSRISSAYLVSLLVPPHFHQSLQHWRFVAETVSMRRSSLSQAALQVFRSPELARDRLVRVKINVLWIHTTSCTSVASSSTSKCSSYKKHLIRCPWESCLDTS